eukprot:364406-Chlamydomonas_euryale.AAC.6
MKEAGRLKGAECAKVGRSTLLQGVQRSAGRKSARMQNTWNFAGFKVDRKNSHAAPEAHAAPPHTRGARGSTPHSVAEPCCSRGACGATPHPVAEPCCSRGARSATPHSVAEPCCSRGARGATPHSVAEPKRR